MKRKANRHVDDKEDESETARDATARRISSPQKIATPSFAAQNSHLRRPMLPHNINKTMWLTTQEVVALAHHKSAKIQRTASRPVSAFLSCENRPRRRTTAPLPQVLVVLPHSVVFRLLCAGCACSTWSSSASCPPLVPLDAVARRSTSSAAASTSSQGRSSPPAPFSSPLAGASAASWSSPLEVEDDSDGDEDDDAAGSRPPGAVASLHPLPR